MTSFPGENTAVPKRLLEALPNQPLSYLVPKDNLSALINSKFSTSIDVSDDPSLSTSSKEDRNITLANNIRKFYYSDTIDENSKILYRKPINITHHSKNIPNSNDNELFNKLSPLAKQCLTELSPNINQREYSLGTQAVESLERKRKMENILDTDLDLTYSVKNKHTSISNGVSINESAIGVQYLEEFDSLMQHIRSDTTSNNYSNQEYWIYNDDENIYLNERTLQQISLMLKNIMSVPDLRNDVKLDNLVLLLDSMINNITNCESSTSSNGKGSGITKRIANMSVYIIYSVFLLKRRERQLYLEKFITVPTVYLSRFITEIKEKYTAKNIHPDLVLLSQSIQLLPAYIRQNTYLDDGFLTKLIYLFADLITDSTIVFNSNASSQHAWDNIKSFCSDALVAIFQVVPTQRLFLINELLSNIDKFPPKRVQRTLNKVTKNKYATYFSTCLLTLLQNLNSFEVLTHTEGTTEDLIALFKAKNKEQEKCVSDFIEHINEMILKRFLQNSTKYRYIMESFIQDLIVLFRLPAWFIASEILSSMLSKLLAILDSETTPSLIETACLQTVGQIGSAIFDVKHNTIPKQDNNIVKLYNYPEYIPQFLKSFNNCVDYTREAGIEPASYQYLQCKQFHKLLKLYELNTDTNNISEIDTYINDLLIRVRDCNSSTKKILLFEDINSDFCSVLQSDMLVPQYESYFHILLNLLDSNKIKLKSTVIKALSLIVAKDSTILINPIVKSTISQILKDDSAASVKDAVLDLIGTGSGYMEYYKQININFDDDSVLVRKHILKINEQIYDECDDTEINVYVASRILLKTEDEEDAIIESAQKVLLNNWILSFDDTNQRNENETIAIRKNISVIAGVISLDKRNAEVFDWFLNFYLLERHNHPAHIFKHILKNLTAMTDALVQEIINLQLRDTNNETQNEEIESYLKLLSLFSDTTVSLITREHISGLYPYILSDGNGAFHYNILHVFNNTLQKLSNFKVKFLDDIETDILKQLVKLNTDEINEAVSIVWSTATQRNNKTRIIQACSSCLVHLNPYIVEATNSAEEFKIDAKIQRILYLVTAFARFCPFDLSTDKLPFISKSETLPEYVAKCLLVLSRTNIPHSLRRTSIKNLIKLCGSYPKLFNSRHILQLLENEMKGSSLDIKLAILEGLHDFFTAEEDTSLRQIGLAGTVSSSSHLGRKGKLHKSMNDDSVCSALSNKFIDKILEMCLLQNCSDSIVAIKLLKRIASSGYINPSKCIPHSIGLLASNDKTSKQLAKEILVDLLEKHEGLVLNNISKGILVAIDYSKILHGAVYYKYNLFLHTLQDIMSEDKKSIAKFSKHLDKFISTQVNDTMSVDSNFNKMSSILFLTTNIANIDFDSQGQFFSLIKILDFAEEQLRDNILEVLKDEEERNGNSAAIKLSIIIQYSLKELKSYLFDKYGFKESMLDTLLETSSETRTRQMPMKREDCHSFVESIDNIVRTCNDDQICAIYLKEQQYID
ncbi:sister chromatid cohesion protein 2 [Monosporozyma servazzii]